MYINLSYLNSLIDFHKQNIMQNLESILCFTSGRDNLMVMSHIYWVCFNTSLYPGFIFKEHLLVFDKNFINLAWNNHNTKELLQKIGHL